MNCRVHTTSGAMYTINEDEMTWHRRTPASGQGVIGIDEDHGILTDYVIVTLGDRLIVPIQSPSGNTYIKTSPVIMAEVLN